MLRLRIWIALWEDEVFGQFVSQGALDRLRFRIAENGGGDCLSPLGGTRSQGTTRAT